MEPFVPEPEERISTKSDTTKGKKNKGAVGPVTPYSALLSLPVLLPAAVGVAVVFGLLLMFSGDPDSERMEQLGSQVETLERQLAEISASAESGTRPNHGDTGGATDNGASGSVVSDGGTIARLNKLESVVASQGSDLETMRIMVAETLSKFDSDLEGSLVNLYEKNRQEIDKLKAELPEVAKLQASLASMDKEVESLSVQIDASEEADERLTERLAQLDSGLASQQQSVVGLGETSKALDKSMAGVRSKIEEVSEAVQSRVTLQSLETALEERAEIAGEQLAELRKALATLESDLQAKAPAQAVEQLAGSLEKQLDTVEQQLAGVAAGLEAKLDSAVYTQAAVDASTELEAVKEHLSTLDSQLATKVAGASLEQVASTLNGQVETIDARLSALDAEVRTRAGAQHVEQLTSTLNGELDQIRQQVTAVKSGLEAKLDGTAHKERTALITQELDAVKEGLAALGSELGANATGSDVVQATSPLKGEVETIRAQISALQRDLQSQAPLPTVDQVAVKISTELEPVKARLAELDSDLKSRVSRQSFDEIASRIETLSGEVETRVSSDNLKQVSTRLDGELLAFKQQLTAFTADLESKASTQNLENFSAALKGDVAGLQQQIGEINSGLAASLEKLSEQDARYGQLREQFSLRNASVQPAVPADLDLTIDELKQSQQTLARNLEATRSQLAAFSDDIQAEIAALEARPRGAVQEATPDVSRLRSQLASLSDQLTQTRVRLAAYDGQIDGLRSDFETRLTATVAELDQLAADVQQEGGAGDVQAQVDKLLKNFEVVKKQHPYAEFID